MTARGVARLSIGVCTATAVGLALLARGAVRAIADAVRLPGEFRRIPDVDSLLAGLEQHAWPDQ